MTTFSLPAGKYWVGDLCYVIDDDTWQDRVCNESFDEQGRSLDVKLDVPGGVLVIGHTAYGDGLYEGSDGFDYPVDSSRTRGMTVVTDSNGRINFFDVIGRDDQH